jgi:hypothetical protein
MIQSSERFGELVKYGGQFAARASVIINGDVVTDTFYGDDLRLLADSSQVTYDREGDARMQADLTMIGKKSALEMLDPMANAEVAPYIGALVDGEWEWIPLGIVGIVELDRSANGGMVTYTCSCLDRSERISGNPWEVPFQVEIGTPNVTGIRNIINSRATGFTPVYDLQTAIANTTPNLFFSEADDPWQAAVKLAQADSSELYFDRYGWLTSREIVDPDSKEAVWTLGAGEFGVNIKPPSINTSRRELFTGVTCRSEVPWLLFPVGATVWDNDPTSRTYYLGPLGRRPKTITDGLATSEAQCTSIARAELNRIRGVAETVDFGSLRDPRLEVGDVIEAVAEEIDGTGRYSVQRLTVDMSMNTMTGTLRRRR